MLIDVQTLNLEEVFIEKYGSAPEKLATFFAPGRVNLIGEHIDYNGGLVFPAALSIGITAIVRKRKDTLVKLNSLNAKGEVQFDIRSTLEFDKTDGWGNYPKGVIKAAKSIFGPFYGFEVLFSSTIPDGAGLSSSAAIEVLMFYIISNYVANDPTFNRVTIAQTCQKVENEYIGVNCGIMDQFAISLGKKNNAILLDCQTLAYEYVPLELKEYSLVIMNTNKKRALMESKYNERRGECETALATLKKYDPLIVNLCQAKLMQVQELLKNNPIVQKRARHVVTENTRVQKSVEVLRNGNIKEFGKLMSESHESLKFDYEVTGLELDTLVYEAIKTDGCIGARMTGAGFGGCAIALVKKDCIETFKNSIQLEYKDKTGLTAEFYESSIGNGVHQIN